MIKIILISIYIIVLCILIYTRLKDKHKAGLICKSVLGVLFIAMALLLLYEKKFTDLSSLLIIFALLCSAVGDIFLGICKVDTANKDYYYYFAVIIVLISQVSYLSVSIVLAKFNLLSLPSAAALILVMYIILSRKYKLHRQAVAASLYSVVLSTSMLNAVFNIGSCASGKLYIFACGMVLYWISDIILFLVKFGSKSRTLDIMNKILYYTAQIVIACCIAF